MAKVKYENENVSLTTKKYNLEKIKELDEAYFQLMKI